MSRESGNQGRKISEFRKLVPSMRELRMPDVATASFFAVVVIIGLTLYLRKRYKKTSGVKPKAMTFEIGDTEKSRAFLARNPQFPAVLDRLMIVANKCFGRNPASKNQIEHICFWLGHTCRQDFVEIVFLAVNGYGGGATKILRCLYERAVTIDYIIKNPEKVGRFVRFAAIQEHRALEAALRAGITESRIDTDVGPPNTVAEIRERFIKHKGEFKATECEICGIKTPASWDIDFSSMVRQVGEPFNKLFLLANNNPNFLIHATLSSAEPRDDSREEADAQTAVMIAIDLLISVMKSQNALFGLKLDADINLCGKDLLDAQARELEQKPNRACGLVGSPFAPLH